MITFPTAKVSFRAARWLPLIAPLFCCFAGLASKPSEDENSLRKFLAETFHGPSQVLAHKESRPITHRGKYLSAVLCQLRDKRSALLIIEVRDHRVREVWSSLKVVKSLGVVSPRNLELIGSGEGEFFTLWGCNPHDCGGTAGTYQFEIFNVANKNMLVLDVRQCVSGRATSDSAQVRMCVTNLIDEDAEMSLATQNMVSQKIRSDIKGAEDALVEF